MREQVAALSINGEPDVSPLIERNADLIFSDVRLSAPVKGTTGGDAPARYASLATWVQPNTLAMMAWLFKPALIAALDREIDACADDANALLPEQREVKAAEINSDLLATERAESDLVWMAQSQGLPVEHRSDVSVLALLGMKLIAAPGLEPRTDGGRSWST
jgi:hypothetical protein